MNIISTCSTIYWMDILLSMSIDKNHYFHTNTTLNEYLAINGSSNDNVKYPTLKYYAIGTGGEAIIDDTTYRYNDHSATDASLRNMVPFVLKKLDEDLTLDEQSNYKFRKEITVGNVSYIAYYLKKITNIKARDEFFKVTTDTSGKSVLTVFSTKNESLLSPTAINKKRLIDTAESSTFVTKIIQFIFNMSLIELNNFQEVVNILGEEHTHITELCICSGIDGHEPANVQVAYFAETNINLASKIITEKPLSIYLEVGSSEPYL